MRILVTDPIAQDGIDALQRAGDIEVDVRLGLKGDALLGAIPDYEALVVRSETKVTADVLQAGRRLQVVGRAGVGVDNIDVDTATRLGIVVVNAPTGNTFSAAELTIGLMMAMARHIPQAHGLLKQGMWRRQDFVGFEVRNKILGVIGLGRVGTEVARRAVGLEMKVVAFDPFVTMEHARNLGVEVVTMDELLARSDIITVHTPLTQGTRGLIGPEELKKVKRGVRIINVARGGIVEEDALAKAIEDGTVAGAAVDVFTQEPINPENPLLASNKIILTPHLGASTEEAQTNVAVDVADQVLAVLNGQPVRYAVNAPLIPAETMTVISPYAGVAQILGRVARQLVQGQPDSVEISYQGDIANHDTAPLKAAVLGGMLEGVTEERVSLVNAHLVAQQRGLHVNEYKQPSTEDTQAPLVSVKLQATGGTTVVAGTQMRGEPHILQIDGYWLDIVPSSNYLLLVENTDRPGVIGRVGTMLGEADINIAFMQVGRDRPRGNALMVLGLDEPASDGQLRQIEEIQGIHSAKLVKL